MITTTPSPCPHRSYVGVATKRPDTTPGDGPTVAHLCLDCDAQLPAAWGCTDCDWAAIDVRRLCDPVPTITHVLERPCQEHA